jgi:hypothetical protein
MSAARLNRADMCGVGLSFRVLPSGRTLLLGRIPNDADFISGRNL